MHKREVGKSGLCIGVTVAFLLKGGGGRMPNLCFWQVLLEEELQQLEQKRRDLKKDSLLEFQHA